MKRPERVAVAARSFSRHPVLRAELLERFEHVTFNDAGEWLEGKRLIEFLRGHEKAITALERLTEEIFAALPELRLVSKYGVGLDMIDHGAMQRHGVFLSMTPGVNRQSVAELTVSFMICLVHRVPEGTHLVESGGWRQIVGRQLSERTVGIVGCGNVGKAVVRLLKPFGCRVLVHDIVDYHDFYIEHGVRSTSLDELLRTADVVSLHVPLEASTANLFDASRLGQFKKGAMLVNTARGGIVDEAALKRMLETGHLSGAGLDVLAEEPPRDLDLIRLPTVMTTPHIGGSTEESILAMGRAAIAGLESDASHRVSAMTHHGRD